MPARAEEGRYPRIPEPMVFDMIRPMGAERGELEVNALALSPLSGQERALEWAPEIEYAIVDGFGIEFELPFEGTRLAELKMGLQGTFGTMDGGRIVHGVQYLGIYERESRTTSHALLYLIGRRHSERLSTMTMIGVGDVRVGQSEEKAGLLVNHTTFYDIGGKRILGFEVNYKSGHDGGVLLMPQFHAPLLGHTSMQLGAGIDKQRGAPARPVAGLRLIREF
jgi:hypothetical protein